MILIMYHKYYYFVKYIWSKLKVADFLGSENDSFFLDRGSMYYHNLLNNNLTNISNYSQRPAHIYYNYYNVQRGAEDGCIIDIRHSRCVTLISISVVTDQDPRGFPNGTTWMGPGPAHGRLKDTRQGGVDFKLPD